MNWIMILFSIELVITSYKLLCMLNSKKPYTVFPLLNTGLQPRSSRIQLIIHTLLSIILLYSLIKNSVKLFTFVLIAFIAYIVISGMYKNLLGLKKSITINLVTCLLLLLSLWHTYSIGSISDYAYYIIIAFIIFEVTGVTMNIGKGKPLILKGNFSWFTPEIEQWV